MSDSNSLTKAELEHHNKGSSSDVGSAVEYDAAFERRVTRKIDFRLLIILGILYAVALIDRVNIAIARVAGMNIELQLFVGDRYSIVTAIFFVPYIVFELPSNIVLRKVGARNWLSFIVVAWGGVMLAMGYVGNWTHLVICRAFLGFLEAGFFPGCVFLITTWYTRFQTQKRLAVFYLTSLVIAGLSSIMGYGMIQLAGVHGIAGWRWVFIISGAFTMGFGLIAWFLIVDFPDKNKFLTAEETKFVIDRINADRGDAVADKMTAGKIFKHLTSWQIWLYGLAFMGTTMPSYAFSFFLPIILAGGGYSTELSLILTAPPYVFAAIYTMAVAILADKTHKRAPVIILNSLVSIAGLAITAFGGKLGVRYFGTFLGVAGVSASVPAIFALNANNVRSHTARSVSTAIVIGMGGVGGIFAALVFRQQDAPRYVPGITAAIACQGATILIMLVFTAFHIKRNKAADQGKVIFADQPTWRYTI